MAAAPGKQRELVCQGASRGLSLRDACRGPPPPPSPLEQWSCLLWRQETRQTTAVDSATGEPGVRSRSRLSCGCIHRRRKAGRAWPGEVRAELEGAEETLGQDLSFLTSQRPQNDRDLWGLSWSELGQAHPRGSWTRAQPRPSAVNARGRGLAKVEGPTLLMVREERTQDGGSTGPSKVWVTL